MLVACDIYIILHLATCSAHQTMWQTQSHKPSHQPQNHHFDVFSVFFPNGNFTALGWRWLKPPRLLWPQSHPNPPCFRIKFSRCPRAQEIAAPRPFVCHFPWRLSSWYLPGEDPLEASFTWKRYLEKKASCYIRAHSQHDFYQSDEYLLPGLKKGRLQLSGSKLKSALDTR